MIKKLLNSNKLKTILFYIFIFCFCLVAGIKNSNIDVDLYSRLIMGHHIFTQGQVMYKDIVSYTPTHTWYDHEWLSSLILFIIVKYFKVSGILIAKTILCSLTVILVDLFIAFREKTINYKYKTFYIFLFLALLVHVQFFHTLRCQNFTFVFIPLLLIILEYLRNNPNSKIIFSIPVLMLIWLNMHGGSMYGVGLIGLYIIGQMFERKPVKRLILILIPTLLVYLINPWGIDFIKFMISAISVDRTFIAEWQSPFTMEKVFVIAYILIQFFVVFVFMYSQICRKQTLKTFDFVKLFILLSAMIMSLRYIKHSLTYFIIITCYLYDDFKYFFDDIVSLFKKFVKFNISLKPLIYLLYLVFFGYVLSNYNFDSYYKKTISELPLYPLQFLIDNDIKGNVFASYYTSGYIAYRCYPDLKIYMDGRQEQVYSHDIFRDEMNFLFYIGQNPLRIMMKNQPDIIIIENYWRANLFLEHYQNYFKKVYSDKRFNLYLSPKLQPFNYKFPKRVPDFTQEKFLKSKYFN